MVTDFMKILLSDLNKDKSKCDHSYDTVQNIALSLIGGGHTRLVILKCDKCGDMSGFPSSNLDIAIKRGTDETKEKLELFGFEV